MHKLLSNITRTDSYKMSQFLQYPEDTAYINSYIEARGGAQKSVFFGLQAFIKEYLLDPITQADIDFAEQVITAHGEPFNKEGWEYILKAHKGYLPVEISAVPEGTVMNTSNVQVQIINTDPNCAWLTSYLETVLLRAVWYPSTVATKSREMKVIIADALERTSDVPVRDQLSFKLHDFGARGTTCSEAAMLGGMGHIINFLGTDTFESTLGAMKYYNAPNMPAFSIPASEHSSITSWGSEGELDAFKNMIEQFGGEGKIYACVSDSYNIWEAVDEKWPSLKEQIIAKGGTLVVRPDSGDPLSVPIEVIERLMDKVGYTTNSKGFRVLPDYIRVIQGDGIVRESLPEIVNNMIKAGLSLDNLAFGMGGGLLQKVTRDDLKYAMKASARCGFNGVWHDVFKDPVTDKGKRSKKGRLGLVYNCGVGSCSHKTVPLEIAEEKGNVLRAVFRNGELLVDDIFEDIRQRAEILDSEFETPELSMY